MSYGIKNYNTGGNMQLRVKSLKTPADIWCKTSSGNIYNCNECVIEPITLNDSNVREMAVRLERYLKSFGTEFTVEGYPIIPAQMLLSSIPNDLEFIPISRYKKAVNLSKTVLIAYENDDILYRNLRQLNKLLPIFRSAYGITGFDFSPRIGADTIDQKFNILFSRLIDGYLALNGVRILPNLRIGDSGVTVNSLQCYQAHKVFAVGMIGNGRGFENIRMFNLWVTMFYVRPSYLLFYGNLGKKVKQSINALGVDYRVITSYRERCFKREVAHEC